MATANNTAETNTAAAAEDKTKAGAGAAPAAAGAPAAPAATPAPQQAPKASAEEEDGILDSCRGWIRENPMTAVGIAALAGSAIGATIHHFATRSR